MKKINSVFLLGHGAKVNGKDLVLQDLVAGDIHVYKDGKDVGIAQAHILYTDSHQEINANMLVAIQESDMDLYPLVGLSVEDEKIMIDKIELVAVHPNENVLTLRQYRKNHWELSEEQNAVAKMKRMGWDNRRINRALKKI